MTNSNPSAGDAPPIVLVHGLYLNALSWDKWVDRYRERGHEVIAQSWPGMDGSVESLRADPSPIARQSVQGIVEHYERIIRALPQPPIIMGHSLGGTILQLLIDRGLGTAAVGIEAGTVRGVLPLPYSTIKSNFAALRNPIARHKAIPISEKEFHYAFVNTLSEAEGKPYYERYYVPVARDVLLTVAMANLNPFTYVRVDAKRNDRAPMLFIASGKDHVIPPLVNRANVKLYRKSAAFTDYKEYPDRPHFTMAVPGWEEVADYALDWAVRNART